MPGFDLTDPALLLSAEVVADPGPFYDALRAEAPVWRVPGQNTFLVADPDLVRDAVGRPHDFSSNLVALLHRGSDGYLQRFPLAPAGDPTHVLAIADPPRHTQHRKVLQPHLSTAALRRYEKPIREAVDRLLDPLLERGGGDAVEALCDPLPAITICQVLGLPEADVPTIVSLVTRTGLLLDGVTDEAGMVDAGAAAFDLIVYGAEKLDAAGKVQRDESTLLGVLAAAVDGGVLTFEDTVNILVQLFTAGTETTASLIGRAFQTLATHPDIQRELRQHPERIPAFLEEVLRRAGPFQFHYRWTSADTELGSTPIPADSILLLLWAAADRPVPGDAPSTAPFDLDDASPGQHFALGRGLHFCIGAHLARLEGRVAVEQLLARTTEVRLDPSEPATERPSLSLKRLSSLPIRTRE